MGGTGHRQRPCWGPLVVQGPTASDGHYPILQDPLPWQQKVRFAKGIASGMVSLGTNLASGLAGEEGGSSWERCKDCRQALEGSSCGLGS